MIEKKEKLKVEEYYINNFVNLNLNRVLKKEVLSDKFLCMFASLLPWEDVLKYQAPSPNTIKYCIKAKSVIFPVKDRAVVCLKNNKKLPDYQKRYLIKLIKREQPY
ncbi:hypothetical protein PRVXT_000483 [Proteinivorax tanatarense]|uniref:Transposase n=1 Tax=Proteinivorax tanatarense TaxID=1260629 RepID=A0AAU7VMN2_9FIRM